ncbi:DUF805 domain-containing protein [Shewanella yunxiaonensis]|uniref:DUF805 domain-containing protein n=1 Tax=Shewanella yunxiaonensis TaxID=2829809 RepID=A0ABX7YR59_9GAMM|nr:MULTISPECIES: DUF805 domain-containing protein [Shewanella]MDF0534054.1 DUF805 domain-containing protein [Shewanella sp. A32]QUN05155.1 DUF805 domain-containing protein [Shewanella yunxiaonensis]
MDYFLEPIRRYADFTDRTRRRDFWMYVLIYNVISLIISAIEISNDSKWLGGLYGLVLLLPSLAVTARRLHDTGRSGWWQLMWFIPVVGWIVLLVFLCQDSEPGDNEYGRNPKADFAGIE